MTVATEISEFSFVAAGGTTPVSIPFQFRSAADIVVTANDVAQIAGTNFTISGEYPAAVITPLAPVWATGVTIDVIRRTPRKQETDILPGLPLPAELLENEFDRTRLVQQEQDVEIGRSVKVPLGKTAPELNTDGLTDGDLVEWRNNKLQRKNMSAAAGLFAAFDSNADLIGVAGAMPDGVPALASFIAVDGGGVVQGELDRIGARVICVDDFGDTSGVPDFHNAAFEAAIAYINTLNEPAMLCDTPGKSYRLTGSLSRIAKNAKYMNFGQSVITHDAGTLFTWGTGVSNSVVDGGIVGLVYEGAFSPTAGTCVVAQEGMNRLLLKFIRANSLLSLLKAGLSGDAGGYFIDDVRGTTYNGTQDIIRHGTGANAQIRGMDMTARGYNALTYPSGVKRVLDETTLTDATATMLAFGEGRWDTAIIKGILCNGYRYGLDIDRTVANVNVSNMKFAQVFFDYCSEGIRLKNTASGGGINNIDFTDGWVNGLDGFGVHLEGSVGSHRSINFNNVKSFGAGKNNWRLASQTMDGVRLNGCVGEFANRLNGTNVGNVRDDFYAERGGWEVRGSRFGRSADNIAATGVPNWQGRYGATLPTAQADYVFENNTLDGATGAIQAAIGSNTITAGKLFGSSVKNNRRASGASKLEYATTATVTAPTSGDVQTNNTPFTYELHIYGGTITVVNKNGAQIADGGTSLIIAPGETWYVVYTVAPTIKRVVVQ